LGGRNLWKEWFVREFGKSKHHTQSLKAPKINPTLWTQGLIIKLLEATYGQWLYHCIQTHNWVSGTITTACKEEIQREIEAQQDMGIGDDWEKEDRYPSKVNLKMYWCSS
jgi:hypothetical protein